MHFQEEDHHADLRRTVRQIASKFGPDYYAAKAKAGDSTDELWAELANAGFIGVNLPEEFGGGGMGLVELAIVCEEVAAAGCPLLLLLVSSAIAGEVIRDFGSDEQRNYWLPRLASGESKIVFGLTEPDAGSNMHRLSTTARRDGDDWVLSGTKYYISGVDESDAILTVCRTGETPSGRPELTLFLVPTNAANLARTPIAVAAGLPERQYTLFFDDVRVPTSAVVGEAGSGFSQVFHGLNPERVMGAALCVGVARHVLEKATNYARTRTVWDVTIGQHQGVAHPLAKARIKTDLAALMMLKAAWLHDHGLSAAESANMAKYSAGDAATAAVDAAIQTHGGNGMSEEYGVAQYWGIARLHEIAPVSREMVLNYVAQHTLGLGRSY